MQSNATILRMRKLTRSCLLKFDDFSQINRARVHDRKWILFLQIDPDRAQTATDFISRRVAEVLAIYHSPNLTFTFVAEIYKSEENLSNRFRSNSKCPGSASMASHYVRVRLFLFIFVLTYSLCFPIINSHSSEPFSKSANFPSVK